VSLNFVKLLPIFDSIRMLAADVTEYGNFPDLPVQNESVKEGKYKLKQASEVSVAANDKDTAAKLWFKSPVHYHSTHGHGDLTDSSSL
jgi:hypothetical protein